MSLSLEIDGGTPTETMLVERQLRHLTVYGGVSIHAHCSEVS